MRTLLRWIIGTGLLVVVVSIVVILNALVLPPDAPFLMGDPGEAERTMTTIAIRSLCCLAAISAMFILFLKRFRPGYE